MADLAAWASDNGDFIIVGDENCKVGDPIIIIPLNNEAILAWIKMLLTMLEDGEIQDVPGELGKCTGGVE